MQISEKAKGRPHSTNEIALRFFELAFVLVRFNHIASFIVHADHSVMRAAVELRVFDCVIQFSVTQPTEWQRIGD
jgi:hypothetical protein